MKTKLLLTTLLSFYFCLLSSQIPQGFNYQAIARDGSGNPITNALMPVRLTIQADSAGTVVIWQELFSSVTTNSFGLFTLVVGRGVRQSGSALTFDAIDWSVTPKFIKTEVNYGGWKDMGTTRFWSVPYSLYAKTAANGFSGNYNDLINKPTILNSQWTTSGTSIYYNSGNVGIGTPTPGNKLVVIGDANINTNYFTQGGMELGQTGTGNRFSGIDFHGDDTYTDYALRILRYNTGVNANSYIEHRGTGELNIRTDEAGPITFATSSVERLRVTPGGNIGIGIVAPASKVVIQPPTGWDDNTPLFDVKNQAGVSVFTVYNNGVRMFVQKNSGKGVKGGFAIGGFDPSKVGNVNLMSISPDSIRFYIDNGTTKATTKGGFAIGSFDNSKGVNEDFMYVTPQASGNGKYNTFLGYQSGLVSTTGKYNTFYGYQSGCSDTSGWANVFIGYQAGKSNTGSPDPVHQPFSANFNIFIGRSAGTSNTTGGSNVFIGDNSGQASTTSFENAYVGNRAGCLNPTGTGNAIFGSDAGYSSTGSYNTYIGCKSGYSNSTGSYNVFIGYAAGYSETGSNKLYIAKSSTNPPLIYGDFSTGSLGFGTITPGTRLEIKSDPVSLLQLRLTDAALNKKWDIAVDAGYGDNTNDDLYILNNAGTHVAVLTNSGSIGIGTNTPGSYKLYVSGAAYATGGWSGSDIRWKKNISPLEYGLNDILRLQGVNYEWRQDEFPAIGFDSGKQIGLIAQEVEKVFPELVRTDDNGYKAVSYEKLSVILLKGMQEQQKQIESQRKEIDELKAMVSTLVANQEGKGNK